MLLKRVLSVLFALLMIFGMVTVSASAVSDGASDVPEEETVFTDVAVVRSRDADLSVKSDLFFFEKVIFFVETKFFDNYKIGTVRKLEYAAEKGGDKWALTNDINVRSEILVCVHRGLRINAQGCSISKTNNNQDPIFYVTGSSSLRICNVQLNNKNGSCIVNEGYTVLEGESCVRSNDSGGICIRNESGGTLELLDVCCDCIFNRGILKMTKDRFPDIAKVVSEKDSKIIMEAGHIGTLLYNSEQLNDILTVTGGEIDEYDALQPVSFEWPLPGTLKTYIAAPFGYYSPVTESKTFHKGVDIAAVGGITGQPVLAAAAGEVIKAGYDDSRGNYILISHNGVYTTLYAHCSKLLVRTGDWVTVGQHIADAGSTGYATGPHLHFAVIEYGKYVDPMNFVKQP